MQTKKLLSIFMLMLIFSFLFTSFSSATVTVSNPSPTNGATGVTPSATLAVTAWFNSSNASRLMKVRCWTNASGSFVWSNWAGPGTNNTVNWVINASEYSTKYWWGVSANDSYASIDNNTYTFTTEDEPIPEVTLTDTIVGLATSFITIFVTVFFFVCLFKLLGKVKIF